MRLHLCVCCVYIFSGELPRHEQQQCLYACVCTRRPVAPSSAHWRCRRFAWWLLFVVSYVDSFLFVEYLSTFLCSLFLMLTTGDRHTPACAFGTLHATQRVDAHCDKLATVVTEIGSRIDIFLSAMEEMDHGKPLFSLAISFAFVLSPTQMRCLLFSNSSRRSMCAPLSLLTRYLVQRWSKQAAAWLRSNHTNNPSHLSHFAQQLPSPHSQQHV